MKQEVRNLVLTVIVFIMFTSLFGCNKASDPVSPTSPVTPDSIYFYKDVVSFTTSGHIDFYVDLKTGYDSVNVSFKVFQCQAGAYTDTWNDTLVNFYIPEYSNTSYSYTHKISGLTGLKKYTVGCLTNSGNCYVSAGEIKIKSYPKK